MKEQCEGKVLYNSVFPDYNPYLVKMRTKKYEIALVLNGESMT